MTLKIQQIDQGIDALLENASQLVFEANALLKVSAYARAFALAHLAREELSKVTMLFSSGVQVLGGKNIDWSRLMKRLRDHKSKLRMDIVENALFMKGNNIHEAADAALSNISAYCDIRNSQKNGALYVGYADGHFTSPNEVINERLARRTVWIAEARLQQQVRIRTAVPSLAASQGKLRSLPPDLSKLDEKAFKESLDGLAKIWAALLKELETPKTFP